MLRHEHLPPERKEPEEHPFCPDTRSGYPPLSFDENALEALVSFLFMLIVLKEVIPKFLIYVLKKREFIGLESLAEKRTTIEP